MRVFLLLLLLIAKPSLGQRISADQIYADAITSYLRFDNAVRPKKLDTLYVLASDSIAYKLSPKVDNISVAVLDWPSLADRLINGRASFYIMIVPVKTLGKTSLVDIIGHQLSTEDGNLIVGKQRQFDEILYTANNKRTKFKQLKIYRQQGFCTEYFTLDPKTLKLSNTLTTCI